MTTMFGIVYRLWDYAADGGRLLEHAAGEIGPDELVVPVVTGPASYFRPALAPAEPCFHTDGGWHFPVTTKLYTASGLRPVRPRGAAATDTLARLREHAEKLSIRLVVQLDLGSLTTLVAESPQLARRNAWGQELPAAGPCPCNPAVRELLRATLDDLQRYQPAGFQLRDVLPDGGARGAGPPISSWLAERGYPLDLCFCPACRQVAERAGVDSESAARRIREGVLRLYNRPPDAGPIEAPQDGLAAYIRVRRCDSLSWLHRLAAGDPGRRYWLVATPDDAESGEAESGPARLVAWPTDRELDESAFSGWLDRAAASHAGWCLYTWRPCFAAPARLVRLVSEAARRGVPRIDFDGVADGSREVITWLRQAVRFARRDAPIGPTNPG